MGVRGDAILAAALVLVGCEESSAPLGPGAPLARRPSAPTPRPLAIHSGVSLPEELLERARQSSWGDLGVLARDGPVDTGFVAKHSGGGEMGRVVVSYSQDRGVAPGMPTSPTSYRGLVVDEQGQVWRTFGGKARDAPHCTRELELLPKRRDVPFSLSVRVGKVPLEDVAERARQARSLTREERVLTVYGPGEREPVVTGTVGGVTLAIEGEGRRKRVVGQEKLIAWLVALHEQAPSGLPSWSLASIYPRRESSVWVDGRPIGRGRAFVVCVRPGRHGVVFKSNDAIAREFSAKIGKHPIVRP